MIRLGKWITRIGPLVCLVVAASAGLAQDADVVGASPRRLMQAAVGRALSATGLRIESGSVERGMFTTAWTPIESGRVSVVTRDGAKPDPWGRAEYRINMSLSIAADGVMNSGLRAEILAWPEKSGSTATGAGTALTSNGGLERSFMQALGAEVDRIAHLFPHDQADAENSAQLAAPSSQAAK
jgi:hypothetical protein